MPPVMPVAIIASRVAASAAIIRMVISVGWQDDSDGVNQKTRGAAAGQAGFGVVMARDFKVVEVAIWRKAIPAICALAPYMVSGIAYDFGRRMVSLEIGMAQ